MRSRYGTVHPGFWDTLRVSFKVPRVLQDVRDPVGRLVWTRVGHPEQTVVTRKDWLDGRLL